MIKISFSAAVILYLFGSSFLTLLVWMIFSKDVKFVSSAIVEKVVWRCHICMLEYVDSVNEEFSDCPRCHSYNKKEDRQIN